MQSASLLSGPFSARLLALSSDTWNLVLGAWQGPGAEDPDLVSLLGSVGAADFDLGTFGPIVRAHC